MKAAEIRGLNPSDTEKRLDEAHKELLNLRFRLETRQLENTSALRKARKAIARLKTVQRERELQGRSAD